MTRGPIAAKERRGQAPSFAQVWGGGSHKPHSVERSANQTAGKASVTDSALFLLCMTALWLLSGCSIRKMAVHSLADTLASDGAGVFASDDDPELVGAALPFALKTMEALIREAPEHRQLLVSTAAAFVQYTHAYVAGPAKVLAYTDLEAARYERVRARRLFLRARDYGLRALKLTHPDLPQNLRTDPQVALSETEKADVPALYWTGVAWASAISVAKDDMGLVADLGAVEALLERALHLDESWGEGAIHEFFIVFEAGRPEAVGGWVAAAEAHFRRAVELNGGRSIGALVAFAESVCVQTQDRQRFKKLLNRALEFDVDRYPDHRLANVLAQRRARHLLDHVDDLFFVAEHDAGNTEGGSEESSSNKRTSDKEDAS